MSNFDELYRTLKKQRVAIWHLYMRPIEVHLGKEEVSLLRNKIDEMAGHLDSDRPRSTGGRLVFMGVPVIEGSEESLALMIGK